MGRPAKALTGVTRSVGSNPTFSATPNEPGAALVLGSFASVPARGCVALLDLEAGGARRSPSPHGEVSPARGLVDRSEALPSIGVGGRVIEGCPVGSLRS